MGGRPPLLNETCVAAATLGYKSFNNIDWSIAKKCAYTVKGERSWDDFIPAFFLVLWVAAATAFLFTRFSPSTHVVRRLRGLPSHQLHRALEMEYSRQYLGRKGQRVFDNQGVRYLSVQYAEDNVARRRTVIIVEDMDRGPVRAPRDATIPYRGQQALRVDGGGYDAGLPAPRPFVNSNIGIPAVAAPPPVATRDENSQVTSNTPSTMGTVGIDPLPPPYKQHQWRSVV